LVYRELRNQIVYASLVLAGAAIGSRFSLTFVALGVSLAIIHMFVMTSRLALRATGLSWTRYFRAQATAIVTGAVTGVVALSLRLSLEMYGATHALASVVILAGATVPVAVSILWTLGGPGFGKLRESLPRICVAAIEIVRPPAKHADLSPSLR
jgi:hypothetical protein